MEFSRQEYWSGLPFPSPGYLRDPGIEDPGSPALTGGFFITNTTWEALIWSAKMFSHCVGCIFIFLMVCYKAQKVLIMAKPNLSIFFVRCGFDVISKKAFSNSR